MTAPATVDRRRAVLRVLAALAIVAVSWWFAGWVGIVTAVIALAVNELAGPRWVALGAAGALVIAAIATLLEADTLNIAYTTSRPIAGEVGKIAGVLAFVALMSFVMRERQPTQRGES